MDTSCGHCCCVTCPCAQQVKTQCCCELPCEHSRTCRCCLYACLRQVLGHWCSDCCETAPAAHQASKVLCHCQRLLVACAHLLSAHSQKLWASVARPQHDHLKLRNGNCKQVLTFCQPHTTWPEPLQPVVRSMKVNGRNQYQPMGKVNVIQCRKIHEAILSTMSNISLVLYARSTGHVVGAR